MRLTREEREAVLEKVDRLVRRKYFDPKFNGKDWPALVQARRVEILDQEDADHFEKLMHDLVRQLGTSHTGFFHQALRRVPARLAIAATLRKQETGDGPRWVFQDVHEGGPAHRAGIKPLDILIAVDQKSVAPPEPLTLPMAADVSLKVETWEGRRMLLNISVPKPRWRKIPYAEPRSLSFTELEPGVGYLKATIFPGVIGIDVAREIDQAVRALQDCRRLILDLRGHLGGGVGGLRLMSFLTPDQIPVGYSLTRRRAELGYTKERLLQFRRIPASKLGLLWLMVRFAGRDQSVVLVTEGLGPQKFHRRIVMLVNEHTASAGEMIAAFAAENGLATIVGTETGGRLLGGTGFHVGHDYLLILPVGAYLTWQGHSYEGRGVTPHVSVEWSPESVREGRDNQLEKALEVVKAM